MGWESFGEEKMERAARVLLRRNKRLRGMGSGSLADVQVSEEKSNKALNRSRSGSLADVQVSEDLVSVIALPSWLSSLANGQVSEDIGQTTHATHG